MSVEILSRIQFATVAIFHFLFVPLTLGLTVMTAFIETRYVVTGNEVYLRMAKFWSRLLLVNFAIGVVTGITLEFQFGMNWARYAKFVGDIFGAPLAIEATVAFFLESTFIGLWMFSWKRVSKGVHAAIMWVVAFASTLSAVWILLANGWMQYPRGYAIVGGHAHLTDFWLFLTTPYSWIKIFHVLMAAYTLTAFFIMGISAMHLLRHNEPEMFKRSFRIGATFGLAASVLVIFAGDQSGLQVAKHQPTKLAAMESQWQTQSGAPFYVLAFPDPKAHKDYFDLLAIPKGLSLLAYHNPNATVRGLDSFPPNDLPPIIVPFVAFRLMVALGFLFLLLALISCIVAWRDRTESRRGLLKVMIVAMFLPYLAAELGWITAEIGRQPWIVYGVLRTADAFSRSITPADVVISLVAFVVVYALLAVADVYLLSKYARKTNDLREAERG